MTAEEKFVTGVITAILEHGGNLRDDFRLFEIFDVLIDSMGAERANFPSDMLLRIRDRMLKRRNHARAEANEEGLRRLKPPLASSRPAP